jgi:hypothetical protein
MARTQGGAGTGGVDGGDVEPEPVVDAATDSGDVEPEVPLHPEMLGVIQVVP